MAADPTTTPEKYPTQHTSENSPYIPLTTRSPTPIFLTPFFPTDAPVSAEALALPSINLALISPPNPYTLADAEWWINQSLTGQGDLSLCVLRMGCPGPEGRLVGGCGLACEDPKGFWHIPGRRPLNEKEESTTPPNRNVEVGYFLHPDVQGLGIMREAVRAAVHWGRRECGVGDVRLRVEEGNLGSRRVVEGMGEFVDCGKGGVKVMRWPESKGGGDRRAHCWIWRA